MELAATDLPRPRSAAALLRLADRRVLGAWILGFGPVLYLALRGGGYDLMVRSEVALAAWWIVLIGVLAGVFSIARLGRLAWAAIAILTAFTLWSLIASSWSTSAERTVAEVGRLAGYLGFLVLGVCVIRRDTVRHLVGAMGVAFGVVALLAVLSRLDPSAFPHDQLQVYFPLATARLNYPLNYANGTGSFLAMGLPLLLYLATGARTVPARALAAASIPVAILGLVMTASRGGIITGVVAVVVFFAIAPDRLPRLATALTVAAGSAILIGSLVHRHAVRQGLSTPLATTQRHQMTALLVVVCVGIALVQVGIGLAVRYGRRPRELQISRRAATRATLAGVVAAVVIAVAAGLPGTLKHQWDVFKQPNATQSSSNVYSRLGTVAGSHRYQYWQTAVKAYKTKPLQGIGPGTYEFYWAQHSPLYEYIRNAHSLYLETLAETGLPGFVLIVGLLLTLLLTGVIRALRAPPLARAAIAAATASIAAFCASATYDWMWQIAVAPVAALLLGAAILSYQRERRAEPGAEPWWRNWGPRAGFAVAALAAIILVAIPYGATSAFRSSQSEAAAHHTAAALQDAQSAQNLEPYAASPRLQRALVLEQAGDLPSAKLAIAQAITREPNDWQLWLVRSRIAAEAGQARAAVRYFHQAHALDPLSPLTQQ